MARLAFCNYHNMIAILEKCEHNVDFHQMVDFVEASHIRRNLKLKDEAGISSLPDAELFENLTLMGYNISPNQKFTFQKGQFSHQWRTWENIIKTSTLPHDLPPRVTSLAADEGSMQHKLNELTDLCTRLQRQQTEMASNIAAQDLEITSLKARIKLLEDKDGGVTEPSREYATIKGRSLETGEEAAIEKSTERGSNDTEELVNVLTSLDAASILTSGVQVVSIPSAVEVATVSVPTGSGLVPTTSLIFTTASVVTPYSRRKGKEKMVESDTPKKKKLQEQIDVQIAREMEEQLAREDRRRDEQIARDAKITRIHAEEELQMLIDSLDRNNETIAKYLQVYEQFAKDLSIRERIELISDLSSALPPIADEPASPLRDVSQGEACPTYFGFEADQDKANIAKTSTLPHDSAPRVTSLATKEGSMQQSINELTALCTSLQRKHLELLAKFQAQEVEINRLRNRVKTLEDKGGVIGDRSRDDAPIKGRSMDEGEAATERVSDDIEEMATVLTLMDAATILASGVVNVPTGSRSIPTASTPAEGSVPTGSEEVPTASPVFATATVVTPYRRRKGKEVMVESETPKKQKVHEQIDAQVARELEEQLEREDQRRAEQIARDAEIVRIHVKEELQSMIDGLDINNETLAKYLEEYC
uniref:Synaptobrevin, longin-like domain protein n=1 Tax=Tanacetum cinerariifolium TaxID=118510 RepID=A0A6L2J156_TANCI|nr:hypothetical protein [Tanacetum cinerariifolium]